MPEVKVRKTSIILFILLISFFLVACGGGSKSTPPPDNKVSVSIAPSNVNVLMRASQNFTATVAGLSNTAVTFTVVEGTRGGAVTGTGSYLAPQTAGVFHVRAASVEDPSKFAEAVITVRDYQQVQRLADTPDGYDYSATALLQDGSVLVVGGRGFSGPHTRAQRFVATTGTLVPDGTLASNRMAPSAVVLPSGKVLVSGGDDPTLPFDPFRPVLKTTEIYDPATHLFSPGPDMTAPRWHHVATQLKDSRVLITGGLQLSATGNGASGNVEIYDPTTNTFTAAPRMIESGRWRHTATLLPDGRVLVAGGRSNNCTSNCPVLSLNSAEIYDPATGTFTPTGSMNISRHSHTATLLPNGKVLIVGGESTDPLPNGDQVQVCEIYDPASGMFTLSTVMLSPRGSHTATLLNNGKLWIAGGYSLSGVATTTTEFLNVETGQVTQGPELHEYHLRHSAVRLPSGEVVILAGSNGFQPTPAVEILR